MTSPALDNVTYCIVFGIEKEMKVVGHKGIRIVVAAIGQTFSLR